MSLRVVESAVPVALPPFDSQLVHPAFPDSFAPNALAEMGAYRARLAVTQQDREAAFRLRYIVFNLELNEGLAEAHLTGMDYDRFDHACDHLIVEHKPTGRVIGTYRLQSGTTAAANCGYYSEQEFHFTPYEHMRPRMMELGRACIHREHRSAEVLNLLWKGIMRTARSRDIRFLIGCCSLTSQNENEGLGIFAALRSFCVAPELFTMPTREYACQATEAWLGNVQPPKLLRAYLAIGARICSPPAIDRNFGTIDYLTLIDLDTIHPGIARRYQ